MPALYATAREDGSITIIDLSGRIALGEGSALLRTTIRDLLFTVFDVYTDEGTAVKSFL